VTGEVQMEAIIDANGRVQNITVTRSLRPDLDEAAVTTLKRWRFDPARKDGQAMPALLTISMDFHIR